MRDTQLVGTKTIGFTVPAEHFSAMNFYAREHGLPLREFMAHMVQSYLAVMKATPAK
jgi:hypothetical protein